MKLSYFMQQAVDKAEKQAIERFVEINGDIPYVIAYLKNGPYVKVVIREE